MRVLRFTLVSSMSFIQDFVHKKVWFRLISIIDIKKNAFLTQCN